MTLTVPMAGVSGGRSANLASSIEAQTGAADGLAQLGSVAQQVGGVMEADRLSREAARNEVDITRDFNELRRQTEEIGDPDAMEIHWQTGVQQIRNQFAGTRDNGRAVVSEQNKNRFGLHFDSLANSLTHQMGLRALSARRSQREATFMQFEQEAGLAARDLDPAGREALAETGLQQIDEMELTGAKTPAEAERMRIDLRAGLASARVEALEADPQAMLQSLEAGELDDLGGEEVARLTSAAQSAIQTQIGGQIKDVIGLANAGRDRAIADQSDFLSRPDVQAHPDYPKAVAALALREEHGALVSQTPEYLQELVRQERRVAIDVDDPIGNARLEMLEELAAASEKGWGDAPLQHARSIGAAVPDLDMGAAVSDPSTFAAQLAARREYADQVAAGGYTSKPVMFDADELDQIHEMTSVNTPPADRLAVAEAAQAAGIPSSAISTDREFMFAADALSVGVPRSTVQRMLRGQAVLSEQNIVLPPLSKRLPEAFAQIEDFFAMLPDGESAQADVIKAADAIYATRVRSIDPSGDIDTDIYRQAMHEALGGTGAYNRSSEAEGGLQQVRGALTILPRGVTADDADDALYFLAAPRPMPGETGAPADAADRPRGTGAVRRPSRQWSQEFYDRITPDGRTPMAGGEPLSPATLRTSRIVSVGDDRFQLVWDNGRGQVTAAGEDGEPWVFSLRALMREQRR